MTLTPAVYLALLAAITCFYWSIPSSNKTGRALLLAIASGAGVLLISPTAFIVAASTALLASYASEKLAAGQSKALLAVSIAAVLVILAGSRVQPFLGSPATLIDLTGSAFFSLKAVAILSDAYRFSRVTRPLDALLLVLFLPTYEAGPIEQPKTLNKTVCQTAFDPEYFFAGSGRILVGLAKQSYLGPVLVGGFASRLSPWNEVPEFGLGTGIFLLWIFLKWVQIYLMFSGYSDVAIGAAKLLGIKVRENFNLPFLAVNLQDFWKRWHISLIDFMSAYVYQPFVRRTGWRYRGIFVLFLLTGLWHAFTLQYLIWGGLHGTVMASMARWQRSETHDRFQSWLASHRLRLLAANGVSRIATLFFIAWLSAIGGAETWARALYILTFGVIA